MSVTVGQVLELLERIAPLELAEEWDNVGLLAGSRETEVDCVLCALDLNAGVLDEAIEKGVQLIVTHHPILFRGRRNLCEDDPEGRLLCSLIRSGIALIALHTNFDNVHPGVNDALASQLGLTDVVPLKNGMCIGSVEKTTFTEFAETIRRKLGGAARMYGNGEAAVRRVAVLGGAGEDFAEIAVRAGADVYVTGEMAYHKALSAVDCGMCVVEAGHAATEKPSIYMLAGGLQSAANDVQYKIRVLCSAQEPFL